MLGCEAQKNVSIFFFVNIEEPRSQQPAESVVPRSGKLVMGGVVVGFIRFIGFIGFIGLIGFIGFIRSIGFIGFRV